MNAFKTENKEMVSTLTVSINFVLEVLVYAIKLEKKTPGCLYFIDNMTVNSKSLGNLQATY